MLPIMKTSYDNLAINLKKLLLIIYYNYSRAPLSAHKYIVWRPFYQCCVIVYFSSQFDPAPRRGDPVVTRRTPDYFL